MKYKALFPLWILNSKIYLNFVLIAKWLVEWPLIVAKILKSLKIRNYKRETHKPTTLRFWVIVRSHHHLCGWFPRLFSPSTRDINDVVQQSVWSSSLYWKFSWQVVQAACLVERNYNNCASKWCTDERTFVWEANMMNWWTHTWPQRLLWQVWVRNHTLFKKMKIKHFIDLSHLYSCFWSEVVNPPNYLIIQLILSHWKTWRVRVFNLYIF